MKTTYMWTAHKTVPGASQLFTEWIHEILMTEANLDGAIIWVSLVSISSLPPLGSEVFLQLTLIADMAVLLHKVSCGPRDNTDHISREEDSGWRQLQSIPDSAQSPHSSLWMPLRSASFCLLFSDEISGQ